ncbi:MucBP domain-containing protein [Streptococcus entericus]|uniref:MucBP domain-containing protein n=1 Tax=Streptococcus entericus TaxID=155680 RepID=UPI000368C2F7|nr:MucBP domain-containing protein [Streptococcus entericus]
MFNKFMETKSIQHNRKAKGGLVAMALLGSVIISCNTTALADEVTTSAVTVIQPEPLVSSVVTNSVSENTMNEEPVSVTTTEGVELQVSGDISVDSVGSGESRFSVNVKTEVKGNLKSGDSVDYNFSNLPLDSETGLVNKEILSEDGVVIGNLSIIDSSDFIPNEQLNALENSDPAKQSVDLDFTSIGKLRVTFNDNVVNYRDISYVFGYDNSRFLHLIANKDYSYESSISVGDKILSSTIVEVPKVDFTNATSKIEEGSGGSSARVSSNGSKVEGERYYYVLYTDSSKPVLAGTNLFFDLDASSGILFDASKLKVGDVLSATNSRGLYENSQINPQGVVLTKVVKGQFEVVAVAPRRIALKVLNDIDVSGTFSIDLGKVMQLVDSSEKTLDIQNKKIIGLSTTGTIAYTDGSNVTNKFRHYINLVGDKVNSSALMIPRSNVYVEHVSEDGRILKAKANVLRDVNVGTAYSTSELTPDELKVLSPDPKIVETDDKIETITYSYKLVEIPSNFSGNSSLDDILVKYIYRLNETVKTVMKRGSVTVEHVTEDGKVLKTKTDVKRDDVVGTDYAVTELTSEELRALTPVDKVVETDSKIVITSYSYELVRVPENAVGKVVEGETSVKFIYQLVENVVEKSKNPQTPQTPEKPVPSNTPRLPETGEGGSLFTVLAGALSSILGLLGFGRKKD